MIIGFGSTEDAAQNAFNDKVENFVSSLRTSDGSFSDDDISEVKKFIEKLDKESQKADEKYKTSDTFPDRYSYTYSYVLGDCNYIFVKVSFNHINRRHALSPDGWALMQEKKAYFYAARK